MTDPATSTPLEAPPASKVPVVLRIMLAGLLLVPGVIGMAVLGFWVLAWGYEGFRFLGSDREWMPLFIIPSVILILFSVITVGVVLRFARWRKAPTASLLLSVVSVLTIVLGYQLMLDSLSPDDTESPALILTSAILGLVVASVPPFLHWWFARDAQRSESAQG